MAAKHTRLEPENEVARLLRELESAELYEQQLRQTSSVSGTNSLRAMSNGRSPC